MALVVKGTLVIDCDDLSCLTFTDTTGGYSPSNLTGYGAPNPDLADLSQINFSIEDEDANVFEFNNGPYRPNIAGNRSVCLVPSTFLDGSDELVLEQGKTYTLTYDVIFASTGTVSSTVTQAAGVGQPQISRITISGPITGGSVISATLNGEIVTYTVIAGQTNNQIVTGLTNAIIAYAGANPSSDWSNLVSYSSGSNYIDVQGNDNNLSFTLTVSKELSYTLSQDFVFPCCGDAIVSNLATNFSLTQVVGCGAFTFTDTTGTYNAQTNTGGYGAPNPAYADIDSTAIVITLEDGTIITIESFIPTANIPSITIQASDLGYSTSNIPDQIISIEYAVYKAGLCRIGYKKSATLIYCNTQGCISSQIKTVVIEGECTCSGNNCAEVQNVYDMQMLLDGLNATAKYNMACIEGKIQALYQKCKGGCSSCS